MDRITKIIPLFLTWCLLGGCAPQAVVSGSDVLTPAARMLCAQVGGWQVLGGGSSAAVQDVIAGRSDAGLMSRDPKEGELPIGICAAVIAWDPLAVVTAADAPVEHLTLGALRKIYDGAYDNWGAVGGKDRPIVTVHREAGSGTRDTFRGAVGCRTGSHLVAMGDGMMKLLVAGNNCAIGYVSRRLTDDTLREIPVAGVDLRRRIWLIWREDNAAGWRLCRFALSAEGQALLEKAGFLPAEGTT